MLTTRLTAIFLVALFVATSVTCDLFNPHATTRFEVGANVQDVFARNDTLLVAASDSSLLAFDITRPKEPRELWRAALGRDCRCVIAVGAAAYVGTDSGIVVYHLPTGDRTLQYVGGLSQSVAGLVVDSTRLYAATTDGVTVFSLTSPDPVRYIAMSGEPTGVARHDSRLFVSLRDWGVRVLNILPGDSFVLDTLRLGRHNRAEGVTASPGGYCVVSQADSGVVLYYTPTSYSVNLEGWASGTDMSAYGAATTDGVTSLAVYEADSTKVVVDHIDDAGSSIWGEEGPHLLGFTRRICLGGNGYVYTASGEAGIYIIRE